MELILQNERKLLRYTAFMQSFCETILFLSPEGTLLEGHFGGTLQDPGVSLTGLSIYEIFPHIQHQLESTLHSLQDGSIEALSFEFEFPDSPYRYEVKAQWAGQEILLFIQDISHIQQLVNQVEPDYQLTLQELHRSNQELEQFAYAASHDLREPLNKIKSFLSLIKDKYAPQLNAEGLQYIGIVLSASERMTQLIDDLLLYSRVGRSKNSIQEVSLNKVIQEALAEYSDKLKDAIVEVDPMPNVIQEGSQLHILFQNLISNACKFKSPNRPLHIKIRAKVENGMVHIYLSDNGIGFDNQYRERIFGLFERLHSRFEIPGTGIGLALCRRIANNHQGSITATGYPDKGSVFSIHLPISTKE